MAELGDIHRGRRRGVARDRIVVGESLALKFISSTDQVVAAEAVIDVCIYRVDTPIVQRPSASVGLKTDARWAIAKAAAIGEKLIADRVIEPRRELAGQN